MVCLLLFFFQAEDGIRDLTVTGVQTCALPISALAGPLGSSAVGDSARVFRVGAWAARSWLGWEAGGVKAGVEAWGPLRSEERRGGEECRSRWSADYLKKKKRCVL